MFEFFYCKKYESQPPSQVSCLPDAAGFDVALGAAGFHVRHSASWFGHKHTRRWIQSTRFRNAAKPLERNGNKGKQSFRRISMNYLHRSNGILQVLPAHQVAHCRC